jgi:glycosyltransferase involved in cell wall biosynthesis
MKIVFFSHYFPPEGNAPASRTYDHCRSWAAIGHQVTVITCAPNVPTGVVYPGYRNAIWPQREIVDGIQVIRVWTFLAANAGNFHRVINYLSYLLVAPLAFLFFCRRPDVVIATSPQFFCGWAGVIASWLKWTRLIIEIRDIWPESIVTVGAMRDGLGIRILGVLERWMYRSANAIVTVTQGCREKILKRVALADRIVVITNGVDLKRFIPVKPDPAVREKYGLDQHFVCSYVGTIGMAHGLEVVIEAADWMRSSGRQDIRFLMVGDGAERQKLQALARQRGVDSLVQFTGLLNKSDMPQILANSDAVFVHLRKTELFEGAIPSKLFETMAMKRPIILGIHGEAAHLLQEAKAGIVIEPSNPQQLIEAIDNIKHNSSVGLEFGQNGRNYVAQHFSREALAGEFLKLIEQVATSR